MKSKFEINLEYGLLRGFCGLLNMLSYPHTLSLARCFAWFMVKVVRLKRKRTLQRIRDVFLDKTDAEIEAIAYGSLQNVIMNAVEMMRAPHLDRKWMDRYVKDGEVYKARLQELVDEGHGVVIMVPHAGNWYMAAWSMAAYGLPLFAIAARQRNPKIDAWMNRQYGNIEVLDRDNRDTLVKIRNYLAAGRAFAILPDLRVRKRDVTAQFLRGEANVSRAGALFAVKAGAPIVVACMAREGDKHVFHHVGTLRPDPNAKDNRLEAERLTKEALKLLDAEVRARPEQWFWYNKRWILEPVNEEEQ